MKKLKLFPKTFLYVTSLMLVITLISHALIYFLMPVFYVNQRRSNIESDTDALVRALETIPEEEFKDQINQFRKNSDLIVMLSNRNNNCTDEGKELWQIFSNDSNENDIIKEFYVDYTKDSLSISTTVSADNIELERIFYNIQNNRYYLKTIITLDPVKEATDVVLTLLPSTLLICIIISAIFALIYSNAITKPIKKISSVARRMEQLDRNAYCPVTSGGEIGMLAEDLNSLYNNLLTTINRLEDEISKVSESEQSKVDFLRTASHELKTPVTAVSGMLEGMIYNIGRYRDRDTYLKECKKQIDELSSLLREILETSKLDMVSEIEQMEPVDLGQLLDDVIEPYRLIAKSNNVSISLNKRGSFTAEIPKKLFSKALANVVSNAVNYTDHGKSIHIYFLNRNVIIENECTPIHEDILAHLSEPFYRPEFAHSHDSGGNGLGLYITNKILSICGIAHEFKAMENNNGMCFIIYLSYNSQFRD